MARKKNRRKANQAEPSPEEEKVRQEKKKTRLENLEKLHNKISNLQRAGGRRVIKKAIRRPSESHNIKRNMEEVLMKLKAQVVTKEISQIIMVYPQKKIIIDKPIKSGKQTIFFIREANCFIIDYI